MYFETNPLNTKHISRNINNKIPKLENPITDILSLNLQEYLNFDIGN